MRFTIIQLLIAGIALGAPLDKTVRQCMQTISLSYDCLANFSRHR